MGIMGTLVTMVMGGTRGTRGTLVILVTGTTTSMTTGSLVDTQCMWVTDSSTSSERTEVRISIYLSVFFNIQMALSSKFFWFIVFKVNYVY